MTDIPLQSFEAASIDSGRAGIFIRKAGRGSPLLLLHGFPQTHWMWRHIAPLLARRFTVICADLPGYGRSGCPRPTPDHSAHTKRSFAVDLVTMMGKAGFDRFSVAGHDRGARVAYRLALDFPEKVERLAVLDIVPTLDTWERADTRFALGYWPWSLLAQAAPFPERLMTAAPETIVDAALSGWGTPLECFSAEDRREYIQALRDPAHANSICEEYRAAATLDRMHDEVDLENGRRIGCPTLLLWSASGPLSSWYEDVGGPEGLWRRWCDQVQGQAIQGGHFFPEERPQEVAVALERFFSPRGARTQ